MSNASGSKASVNHFARRLLLSTALPVGLIFAGGIPAAYAANPFTITGTAGTNGTNGASPGDSGTTGTVGESVSCTAGPDSDATTTATATGGAGGTGGNGNGSGNAGPGGNGG